MDKELLSYIVENLKNQVSEAYITEQLQKTGISDFQIRQLLKKARKLSEKSSEKKLKSVEDPEARQRQLRAYVENQLARNAEPEKLKASLLKIGWSKDEVEPLFEEVAKERELRDIKRDEQDLRRDPNVKIRDQYQFRFHDMGVKSLIYSERGKPTLNYHLIIPVVSETTDLILERIRIKLIDQINLGSLELSQGDFEKLDKQVQQQILRLIRENFPHMGDSTQHFLATFLISKVLGMGIVEILKADDRLEEIAINESTEPIFVYHKTHGWCKTNIQIATDEKIVHLSGMIGRKIGREISQLAPMLDAHLPGGDRVNATLKPITAKGPTITIRKFSADPWTITKFLQTRTLTLEAAALIWLAIQYEMSAMIVGGTASGKTSCLNTLTTLIPPNQRVISIEDTRELRLPTYMHWVPMVSRAPNPEGKGGVEMEDLLINSLRMRPDRIIVGEVRKKVQAETLFEAIHTGHSVYSTFHANDADEAVIRITNPPIGLPKNVLPAISLIIVQFRNRRTGVRRTFQLAEIMKDG
ncbi:MAG: ATPase, T2SS/T4P/T4SS family, partial [Nanoarchaeota archaeon]|nr:ATPase, T2SS/T4P/T4SS family [Nanoarchaeota archaeon]